MSLVPLSLLLLCSLHCVIVFEEVHIGTGPVCPLFNMLFPCLPISPALQIPDGKDNFEEDDTLNQYVYLQAQFPGHLLERVVLVSFQSGYIFVQTDKTIYTPSSSGGEKRFACE